MPPKQLGPGVDRVLGFSSQSELDWLLDTCSARLLTFSSSWELRVLEESTSWRKDNVGVSMTYFFSQGPKQDANALCQASRNFIMFRRHFNSLSIFWEAILKLYKLTTHNKSSLILQQSQNINIFISKYNNQTKNITGKKKLRMGRRPWVVGPGVMFKIWI